MRKPNDVGVAWKKTNEHGEYFSLAVDVDAILELAGGSIDNANISMYPIRSENPKAPDFQLKFYPKGARTTTSTTSPAFQRPSPPASHQRPSPPETRPRPQAVPPPVDEDDIPF